jgi:peptidoglycan hydrolase-like protein with peptidoglycan-binding domain
MTEKAASPKFPLDKGHYYSRPFTSRKSHSQGVADEKAIRAIQEAVGADVTGSFDEATEAKVKAAQKKARKGESGIVDADTWKILNFQ